MEMALPWSQATLSCMSPSWIVLPDDLIHADRHGAMVILAKHIERMVWAIDVVLRKEVPVLSAARAPGFTVEKLRAGWAEADKIN